jgi:transcriptional regulator with XRE-family HTH domain
MMTRLPDVSAIAAERGKKVPSLDTIVAIAKGLGLQPSKLLLLERDEDPRNVRKRIETLLTACTPQQLDLAHRIIKVVIEP